jgi:polyhydroxybutyrate depolymerase
VIDDIESKYDIDRARVFVGGHSNGAMMAQVLACRSAKRIAGVFSYAGALWSNTSLCNPDDPVSIVELHGDMDTSVPYYGGSNTAFPGGPPYPSAVTTVETWASLDNCAGTLANTGASLDLVPSLAGSETTLAKASLCPAGIDAELWTIHGGSHQDPLNPSTFPDSVWGFFQSHPKSMP